MDPTVDAAPSCLFFCCCETAKECALNVGKWSLREPVMAVGTTDERSGLFEQGPEHHASGTTKRAMTRRVGRERRSLQEWNPRRVRRCEVGAVLVGPPDCLNRPPKIERVLRVPRHNPRVRECRVQHCKHPCVVEKGSVPAE